jgi:hypothetical protein
MKSSSSMNGTYQSCQVPFDDTDARSVFAARSASIPRNVFDIAKSAQSGDHESSEEVVAPRYEPGDEDESDEEAPDDTAFAVLPPAAKRRRVDASPTDVPAAAAGASAAVSVSASFSTARSPSGGSIPAEELRIDYKRKYLLHLRRKRAM